MTTRWQKIPLAWPQRRMIQADLMGRDVRDPDVLDAMARVPRHLFVPPEARECAYDDTPLPIGLGQTISQPYIVAKMTQLCELEPGARVLEIGVGSGYQTAVLLEMGAEVFGVEILAPLVHAAARRLEDLDYRLFTLRQGDGRAGWPEHAPYDAIMVAAAPVEIPPALLDQLTIGGRLVAPAGPEGNQWLYRALRCGPQNIKWEKIFPVRFVPLV